MIIGITGKMQAGKTTVANMIAKKIEMCHLVAFADLLKEMILKSGLCNREELYEKKTDFSRLMMQKIGTEIIREQVDDYFWIKKMDSKIKNIILDYGRLSTIIIHDVRFRNEADLVLQSKVFGRIIKITRPQLTNNENENKHKSETEQESILGHYNIINDGTLQDLEIKVDNVLKDIDIQYQNCDDQNLLFRKG